MVLGPVVNGVVFGRSQKPDASLKAPDKPLISGEKILSGGFHRAGMANPPRGFQGNNVLDLAAEFALQELRQQALVQAVWGVPWREAARIFGVNSDASAT